MPALHDDREEFLERARAANEATCRKAGEGVIASLHSPDPRRTARLVMDAIASGDLPGVIFRA